MPGANFGPLPTAKGCSVAFSTSCLRMETFHLRFRAWCSSGAPLAVIAFSVLLPLTMGRADSVTLNNGGGVHGRLVGYSGTAKSVTLRTSCGTLIVFDRDSVKQVKHGADPRRPPVPSRVPGGCV